MMKKMGDEVLEECMKERYGLAKERIREIITEETVKKPFGDFFRNRAKFLSMAADVMDESAAELTMEVLKERNHCFYQDILPENYESSYGNPAYAVQQMGEYGKAFSFLYAEIAGTVAYAHEKRLWDMTVSMELFLEVYSAFCEEELPEAATVERHRHRECGFRDRPARRGSWCAFFRSDAWWSPAVRLPRCSKE